jgi:hypothetical protein
LSTFARVAFDENLLWLLSQSEKIKSNLIMIDERVYEEDDGDLAFSKHFNDFNIENIIS